jgi:hypothetical protein
MLDFKTQKGTASVEEAQCLAQLQSLEGGSSSSSQDLQVGLQDPSPVEGSIPIK